MEEGRDRYLTILKERNIYCDEPFSEFEKTTYRGQDVCSLFESEPSEFEYMVAKKRVPFKFSSDEQIFEKKIYEQLLLFYSEVKNWRKFQYANNILDKLDRNVVLGGVIGHDRYYEELDRVYTPIFCTNGFSHFEVECDGQFVGVCFELGGDLFIDDIDTPRILPREEMHPVQSLGQCNESVFDRYMKDHNIMYPEPTDDVACCDVIEGCMDSDEVDALGSNVVEARVIPQTILQCDISSESGIMKSSSEVSELGLSDMSLAKIRTIKYNACLSAPIFSLLKKIVTRCYIIFCALKCICVEFFGRFVKIFEHQELSDHWWRQVNISIVLKFYPP